ncbi:hypothetical protein [Actinomadura macra]|uniref:hypothetical protein n=1 Tax=Actinomadura macra TaxID=46164 RepID=UPI00082CE1A2|nr:hypothetical protein [Actinomadura macra]
MREETAPHDEVLARFTGARLYERGEGGISYLAERAGVPYLLVRPGPAAPDMVIIAFEDELERACYLTGRSGQSVPMPRSSAPTMATAVWPAD